MYNFVQLNNKNLNILKRLNLLRNQFNNLNKDFFNFYNNLNFIQKYFTKKRVRLLMYQNDYVGFIWIKYIKNRLYSIQSMHVIPNDSVVQCYKRLLAAVTPRATLVYECENNKINFNILKEVGFKKMDGTFEMCCPLDKNFHYILDSSITIDKFIEKRDENKRCILQNLIFKKNGRIPLSVEDILFDEEQSYYFEDGCFFMNHKHDAIGYGQIIIDEGKPIIVNFGIIEEYRGKGLGKAFLLHLLQWAKDNNFKNMFIKVDSTNIVAFTLYESVGFKMDKEIYKWKIDV